MLDAFWLALALVLVLEGLLPFMNPTAWRRVFERMLLLGDGQLRFMGLVSILIGLALIWWMG